MAALCAVLLLPREDDEVMRLVPVLAVGLDKLLAVPMKERNEVTSLLLEVLPRIFDMREAFDGERVGR